MSEPKDSHDELRLWDWSKTKQINAVIPAELHEIASLFLDKMNLSWSDIIVVELWRAILREQKKDSEEERSG